MGQDIELSAGDCHRLDAYLSSRLQGRSRFQLHGPRKFRTGERKARAGA